MFGKKLMVIGLGLALVSSSAFAAGGKKHGKKGAGAGAAASAATMPESAPAGANGVIKGEEWKAKLQGRATAYTPEQKAAVEKVKADLAGLKTATDSSALAVDLMALITAAEKPAAEKVQKLAADLKTALATAELKDEEQMQLAQDIEILLNKDSVPMEERMSASFDFRTILKTANVADEQLKSIGADMKALVGGAKDQAAGSMPAKAGKHGKGKAKAESAPAESAE